MDSNIVISKKNLKTFCLTRKLKSLEKKRSREIVNFIALYPQQAAKMDDLERNINSESLREISFKIEAINRLLNRFNHN